MRRPTLTRRLSLVSVFILGFAVSCSSAFAFDPAEHDDEHIDWHFDGDDSRRALIDDRGGRGFAYSFSFGAALGDGVEMNHCPHCGFALFALDLNLDQELIDDAILALEQGALAPDQVAKLKKYKSGIEPLINAINQLDTIDWSVVSLPDTFDVDGVKAKVADVKAQLDKAMPLIGFVMGLANDPGAAMTGLVAEALADIKQLVKELGFVVDDPFQNDWNNPNDPNKLNSGVEVFTLQEYAEAAAQQGVISNTASFVQPVLDALPEIPGIPAPMLEISGKPGNPLEPARFHGVRTGLTIEQRTYAIQGVAAVLYEFTVWNNSDKIYPFVEGAFIANVDVRATSSDKETDYDPITGAVMVYDSNPYLNPEVHYWVGIAPVLQPSAIRASYLIDKKRSLSLGTASKYEENRVRFFLGHDEMRGDKDDVPEGSKSEKEVSTAAVILGPMYPQQRRTLSFCMAGAAELDGALAKVETQGLLAACSALAAVVSPACGDGVVGMGEECDPALPMPDDGCSSTCKNEVCGDGVISGDEACDDGNTDHGDACTADCQIAFCGDGVPGAGEECDLGTGVNNNEGAACLVNCKLPTCGDGFFRYCDPDVEPACLGSNQAPERLCAEGHSCLAGVVTFESAYDEVDDNPAADALSYLVGQKVDVAISYELIGTTWRSELPPFPGGDPTLVAEMTLQVYQVSFSGDPTGHLDQEVGFSFAGRTWVVELRATGDVVRLRAERLGVLGAGGTAAYALDLIVPDALDLVFEFMELEVVPAFDVEGILGVLQRQSGPNVNTEYSGVRGAFVGRTIESWVPEAPGQDGELPDWFEECDDGNTSNLDDCVEGCKENVCGDGHVHIGVEQCDRAEHNGAVGSGCSAACQMVDVCGNSVTESAETCDDGNTEDGDGCSALCQLEVCGDGIMQAGAGEACDDGNATDGDGCTACVVDGCGDGTVQSLLGEVCDAGGDNGDDGACLASCKAAACGDGFVRAGAEACDDGNDVAADGCTACVVDVCGDGQLGPGEDCDDGNAAGGDGCTASCTLEACGDALPGLGEQCDDGNVIAGDGCDAGCQLEKLEACGDWVTGPGEQCDDGGTASGDGCSALCQLEDPAACGDGSVDPGEACDDGNKVSGDGCSAWCAVEVCGDGVQHPGEACDDGNNLDGDGCSAGCVPEPSVCGDGTHQLGEQCDDGNAVDGDGCDGACKLEGWDASLVQATCGNGDIDLGEACDDGGQVDGDGCDETCQLEATVCGNGAIELGEACDDANTFVGDGCGATCQLEAQCGNALVEPGEACDDGNTTAGDGCNAACKAEFCGDAVLQGDEQCDAGVANNDHLPDRCRTSCVPASCGDGVADSGECEGPEPACPIDCALSSDGDASGGDTTDGGSDTDASEEDGLGGGCHCQGAGTPLTPGSVAPWLLFALLWLVVLRRR